LKENVIIGKLIPAGTGMSRYRDIQIYSEDELIEEAQDSPADEEAETALASF